MEPLALKYRPRTFDDLVGQKPVQVILRTMVATNKVPTAMLFDGSRGTGKTTTARILAAALNCDTPPGPCTHCVSCKSVHDGTSFDVREIDGASNGLVDDIRALRQEIMYSVGGHYRVVILDEAHSMSTAAFNALLKVLEEPPPATVFVLLTTEPAKIPDTVASRCMPFTFRRIPAADIATRLRHITATETLTVDDELIDLLAARADGGLRDAVMALDQITRAGITTIGDYTNLVGETDPGPALLYAITTAEHGTALAAVEDAMTATGDPGHLVTALTATLRDVLVLHNGGTIVHSGAALTARQELTRRISAAHTVAALKLLWELKTRIRGDDNRTTVDLAVVMLTEQHARATGPATAQPASAGKLSLAQMADMRRP